MLLSTLESVVAAKRRAEVIIAKLLGQPGLTAQDMLIARGIEVLQRCGTRESRALLEEWSKGPPGSPLANEARYAMQLIYFSE